MTDPLFDGDDDGNTPITAEEREALIPTYIALRSELNEAEQLNIISGAKWAFARPRDPLDERTLFDLHGRMFGDVWRWAGERRTSARNIGIDHWRIVPALRELCDDMRYWIEHATFEPDEFAIRFHHRLVQIHIFPNGNGRHARTATDMLLRMIGKEPFSWGQVNLVEAGETRRAYIHALRAADGNHYGPLLAFVRS